jgi:heme-degrading monooxygenase HmoA
MYGTVAHFTIKADSVEAFRELIEAQLREERFISGIIAQFVFWRDDDPRLADMVAIFDTRESYWANATDPAQDKRYREAREFLECDPEWMDGDVEPFLQDPGGDLSGGRYGTVAHMRVLPGKWEEIERMSRQDGGDRRIPGAISDWVFRLDRDPDEFIIVTVFESRELYFANAEDPEQDKSYQRLRALLSEDPVWHDGEVTPYLRF